MCLESIIREIRLSWIRTTQFHNRNQTTLDIVKNSTFGWFCLPVMDKKRTAGEYGPEPPVCHVC